MSLRSLYKSYYFTQRFYAVGAAIALLFAVSFWVPVVEELAKICLACWLIVMVFDVVLLYAASSITAERSCTDRFSNGDENKVSITIKNNYAFNTDAVLIDELPVQFQERNWYRSLQLPARGEATVTYTLQPFERGEYTFGNILVLVTSPLQLVKRKYTIPAEKVVAVYPSYIQMRRFSLQGVSNELQETGSNQLRKQGQSVEFEQIKEYVRGDDYRTINWKATARKGQLMVNTFVDERSQQVYCLVDKSRSMKMPFGGLTLLDYAINASLVLTNVALQKQDKAGLLTFAQKIDTFINADKKPAQMELVLEALYRQQTKFLDPDYETLYAYLRNRVKHRSLLVLFTNFESLYSLQRQMPYLKKISSYHLLVVVFFENTEISSLLQKDATNTEEIYIQTIAEKFAFEKRQMVKELSQQGIPALLSAPENLTVNALNKYLEIKARQMI
ncbi:MAG TPA: DUF58 domain-containing protein [Chitinophagaceae bacterium]|nr:DUF58 domain-containing protein [Chitinophagaceae bacterium]